MKSFLSDRQRLPLKPLVVPPSADAGLAGVAGMTAMSAKRECAPGAGGVPPQVEAVKQGDKVVRLIVTCGCGERIEIDCLYPAGG